MDASETDPRHGEATSQTRSSRLNVVLITLDTARADAFGAYGQRRPTSPNIDRMATEGVLFEEVMSASPSTLPSHATIMTGVLPFAHGARSNTGYVLGIDETTLAERLRSRGYTTAAEIAAPVIGRHTGLDQGFEHYREPGDFDIVRKKVLVADPAEDSGRRLVEAHYRDGSDVTKRGLEFIEQNRRSDRPFFLWLHYFDPHVPYQAPLEFRSGLDGSAYHAEIRYTDHQVGRILDALREGGLRDRTLVVLTSDHGEGLGDHAESSHTYFVYDSTVRVPLLVWGPETVPKGRRVRVPVRTADIAPTVLSWLDMPGSSSFHGRSLRSLADREPGARAPGPGYAESVKPFALFGSSMLRTLRIGDWKYIHKLEPELYRLDEDPAEHTNLATLHPERVSEMQTALSDLVQTSEANRGARVAVDPAQRAQLQALGYLGVETPDDFNDVDDLRTLRGPDPRQAYPDDVLFARAHGLVFEGDGATAAELLRGLLARHPDSDVIRDSLIEALVVAEQWAELSALAAQALQEVSTHLLANKALGLALGELGRVEEALAHWRRAALRLDCDSGMSSRLSILLFEQGREAERIDALTQGLERCPETSIAMNDLSYALSTTADVTLRDGDKALELALRAIEADGRERPDYLDTLACAQARAGDFDGAIGSSTRALELIRLREFPAEVVQNFEAHLASFTAREAIVEAPTSPHDSQ